MELKRLLAYFRGPWAFWDEFRFDGGYKKQLLLAGILIIVTQAIAIAIGVYSNPVEFEEALKQYNSEGHSLGLWFPSLVLFVLSALFDLFEIFLRTVIIYFVASALGAHPRIQKTFLLGLYSSLPEIVFLSIPVVGIFVYVYLAVFLVVGLMKLFNLSGENAIIGLLMGIVLWYLFHWQLGAVLGLLLILISFVSPDFLLNIF